MPISVRDYLRLSSAGGLGGAGGGVTLTQVQTTAEASAEGVKTELADATTAGKGANLIAYTKLTGETGVVAPQYPVGDVRRYGARGDGQSRPLSTIYATLGEAQAVYPHATALTNELDWAAIQSALNNASARSVADNQVGVSVPAGHYIIGQPVRMRHNTALIGEGSPTIESITTSTNSVTKLCLLVGNFHPAHYANLSSKTYNLENISDPAKTITFTTPSQAGNLAVGVPFMVRSTATFTGGTNPIPVFHEANIPTAINVASGVVTLKYPIEESVTSPQAVVMDGSVLDGPGEPIQIVKNVKIDGITFKPNASQQHQWCTLWGAIEATLTNLTIINTRNLLHGNMLCRSFVSNIRGQFSSRAFELKSACCHTIFTDIIATYIENVSPESGEPLIAIGESAHNVIVKNVIVNAGVWNNQSVLSVTGCAYDIVFDEVFIRATSISGTAITLSSATHSAKLQDISFRNFTCYGGSNFPRWMSAGTSGSTGTIPKRYRFQNMKLFGSPTLTSTSAILFSEGTDWDFDDCVFENGRMGQASNTARFRFMRCKIKNRQASQASSGYLAHIWRGNQLEEWATSTRVQQTTLAVNSTTANNVVATYTQQIGARPEDQDCINFAVEANANGTAGTKTIEIRDNTGSLLSVSIASGTTGLHRINGQVIFRDNTTYVATFTVTKPDGTLTTARTVRTSMNILNNGRTFTVQGWVANTADSIDFDSISIMPVPLLGGMPV